MPHERSAVMLEAQAAACTRLGAPLYAAFLQRAAADVRAGGPCAAAIVPHEGNRSGNAVALRFLAAVHGLVLSGRAPALAAFYPSAGGSYDPARPDACWPAFRDTVEREPHWIQNWMTRPLQTNEVGRAGLLISGLLAALGPRPYPVRLIELGCSAGLNLRADRFRYLDKGLEWGPEDSPVVLGDLWQGAPPAWLTEAARLHPTVTICERRGWDLYPVDPQTPQGRLTLRAYVWPDHIARARRLDSAIKIAEDVPADLTTGGALDCLRGLDLETGTLTVIWHSAFRQFVPPPEWALIEDEFDRLAAESSDQAGFAQIAFEPGPSGWQHDFRLTVRLDDAPTRILADADPHGIAIHPPAVT